MTRRDPAEPAFWALGAAVLAWAAYGAATRAPALLAGSERTHTLVALVSWPLFAGVLGWRVLRWARPPVGSDGAFEDLRRQFAKSRTATLGLMGATLLTALAVFAPLCAAYAWDTPWAGPGSAPPGADHWFGTDELGRDVLSRCLFAGRISLTVGFVAVSISASLGTLVGACAGYFGGWVDRALMFVTDLLLALPRLVLLVAILGVARPAGVGRIYFIVALLGTTGWMGVARMVRGQVLSLKEQDFVAAAVALGLPSYRVLLRHVVPNALSPVIVFASLALGGTILAEASLSYLGLGVQPPTSTWGVMISEAGDLWTSAPWVVIFPGLLILWAVLCFNLVGDGLRDALDPRLRGRS